MNKAIPCMLAASITILSASGASAVACPTTITEVAVRSNGTVFTKGDRLPSSGVVLCTITTTTSAVCKAMLQIVNAALLAKHDVTLNVTAGTCTAPTTIEYVKLND